MTRFQVGALAGLVLAAACDQPADSARADAGSGGADAGPAADASIDGGDDNSVRVSGAVVAYTEGYPGVEGATVAIADHPEIDPVLTDAGGRYAFTAVPAGIEIVVRAEFEGHLAAAGRVLQLSSDDYRVPALFLIDLAVLPYFEQLAGMEVDRSLGIVTGGVWDVNDDALEGATVEVAPAAGTLFYYDAAGLPNPRLTSVSPGGLFGVWNLPIGTVELAATHESVTRCYAPGPDEQEPIRLRTFPNTVTFTMGFVCGQ